MQSKTTTTVSYTVEEFNKIINEVFDNRGVSVRYVIQEVGGDPLDRFPGTNQVTKIEITYEGTPDD